MSFEIPVFFNHENGPALTFHPVMEDRSKKLVVQLHVENRLWTIDLEAGDVRQCRDFFNAWLWHEPLFKPAPADVQAAAELLVREGYRVSMQAIGNPGHVIVEERVSDRVSEDSYVQALDDHAIEFRRRYESNSLEAFMAWCRAQVSEVVEIAFKTAVEPKLRRVGSACYSCIRELDGGLESDDVERLRCGNPECYRAVVDGVQFAHLCTECWEALPVEERALYVRIAHFTVEVQVRGHDVTHGVLAQGHPLRPISGSPEVTRLAYDQNDRGEVVTVHVLWHGRVLCGAVHGLPARSWSSMRWVGANDPAWREQATCATCREQAELLQERL